ncbi:hypothetical protein H6F61_00335 [Cyanobacteria bacterium FACHB-472]|nr:hypothetical protein [Cyanobacteria bacterium FACHB-472]
MVAVSQHLSRPLFPSPYPASLQLNSSKTANTTDLLRVAPLPTAKDFLRVDTVIPISSR